MSNELPPENEVEEKAETKDLNVTEQTERLSSGTSIIIERGVVVEFEKLPDRSIALDGYVQGPALDVERNRFSFDHHDKVIRLVTRATCQQVMDALLLGLEVKDFKVYVNDIDGDTALSIWLLKNPHRANEPKVRELVESVGGIDAHGPAYPALNQDLADAFFSIAMKPEADLRRSRQYAQADLNVLLDQVLSNVDKFLDGAVKPEAKLERVYEITHRGEDWVMAQSKDFISDLLYKDGYTRAVMYQQLADGSYAYTVCKKSDLVSRFPVGPASKDGTILYALNQIESGWGGGSSIGGAPRNSDGSRSRLTPDQVFEIIEKLIKKD